MRIIPHFVNGALITLSVTSILTVGPITISLFVFFSQLLGALVHWLQVNYSYWRMLIAGGEKIWCIWGRATQVILFGDVVALQPCNQVKLSGKTCS